MTDPIDEAQLLRDVIDAQKRVDDALGNVQDLETEASGWPGGADIAKLADDASTSLSELSEVLSGYLRGSDG